jgi:hypothetical protein
MNDPYPVLDHQELEVISTPPVPTGSLRPETPDPEADVARLAAGPV